MKIKPFLFMATLLLSQMADAQIMFQEHYGGSEKDGGSSVLQTDDGGYLVIGYTESYGSGGDIFLIKTDQNGNMQWIKTFGSVGREQASSIVKTNDSGYIITGATSSFGYGENDVYCIKLDVNYDTVWTKHYGGSQDDEGYDIIQTSDSGYLFTGYSMSFTSGFSSIYAIKTDSYGDTLWTKTYNKKNANMGSSVIKANSNGYLIVGTTSSYGISNTKDCFIIRIDNAGDTLWTKTIGGSFDDYSVSAMVTNDGDFIVCGITNGIGNGYFDVFYFKINSSGDIIWSRTLGGTAYDDGRMIIPTTDNAFAIVGTTSSFGAGGEDVYLMKLNQNGDTLWTKTFGNIGDEGAESIKETNDGGFVLSGYTNSFGGNYDVYLIKTDANGISGFEKIIRFNLNCLVYPNPCKGILNILMNNFSGNDFLIELFNINGQLVHAEKYENNNSTSNQLNLTNYPKGFYLLRICANNQTIIKKIIYY